MIHPPVSSNMACWKMDHLQLGGFPRYIRPFSSGMFHCLVWFPEGKPQVEWTMDRKFWDLWKSKLSSKHLVLSTANDHWKYGHNDTVHNQTQKNIQYGYSSFTYSISCFHTFPYWILIDSWMSWPKNSWAVFKIPCRISQEVAKQKDVW